MLAFLKKHNILYKLQFGFRENHSTVMALIEALNEMYKSLDEGKFVLGVFLDLKKAFDTIDHKILLKKLEHYGFRGIVNKWFSSYLLNRKQFTSVNGNCSTLSSISTGIPQGSVLGPLLFTIYVNDIANSTHLQPRLFADDTNIFAANENITHLIQNTNTELAKIDTWFKANRLKLSVDKTTYCVYSPKKKLVMNTPDVRIGDVIQKSDSVRYLGLIIDEKLTWEKHIDELGNKVNRYASIFRKIRHLLPKNCLQSIYNAFIQSRIDYAIEIYGDATKKLIQRSQVHQNRVLKILQYKRRLASTNEIHKDFQVLKISDQYEHKILKLMHMYVNNKDKLPAVFQNLFQTRSSLHNYETRHSDLFQVPKTKTRFGNCAISVKGAKLWNSQPPHLRKIQALTSYLKALKEYQIGSYL